MPETTGPYPSPTLYPAPSLYPSFVDEVEAVTLTGVPAEVLEAAEDLLAYRLRQSGFSSGQGGREVPHFTEVTTPTLARAQRVAVRKAGELAREFVVDVADHDDLVTIAALRAAIELEASAPNMDPERIRTWRDQLREYIARAAAAGSASSGGGGGVVGAAELPPVWGFGPRVPVRAEGAECPIVPDRRLRW